MASLFGALKGFLKGTKGSSVVNTLQKNWDTVKGDSVIDFFTSTSPDELVSMGVTPGDVIANLKYRLNNLGVKNQRRTRLNQQKQYEAYSTGQRDTVSSPITAYDRKPDIPTVDRATYNKAAGRTDRINIINEEVYHRTNPDNTPATLEQLEKENKYFANIHATADYNSQPQKPPPEPDYNNAKGSKDNTNTWHEERKRSWKNHTSSDGSGDVIPYVDAKTRRREIIDRMAETGLKQKILEEANKTPWEHVKDKISTIFTGSGFNKNTTANRRAYNEYLHSQGSDAYIKTNREYERILSSMGFYGNITGNPEGLDALRRAQTRINEAAEISGVGKKSNGVGSGANGPSNGSVTGEGEAAGNVAIGSFTKGIKDIYEWGAKDGANAAMLASY